MGRKDLGELRARLQAQIDQSRSVLNAIDNDWPLCPFMPDQLHTIRKETVDYLRRLHRDMVSLRATERKLRPPDPVFRFHGFAPYFSCGSHT